MKRIIAVRHAKASNPDYGQKDFDRPLADRGKKDAKDMGAKLYGEGIVIDRFVTSPAKRARSTCKAFVQEYNRLKEEIINAEKLYNAPMSAFYEIIEKLDNSNDNVAVFAHNPGITDFVNSLCEDVHVDDMPTCAVFSVEADIADWKDFKRAKKTFIFFEYPKLFGSL
jgi:phosphohistidine phosphatase